MLKVLAEISPSNPCDPKALNTQFQIVFYCWDVDDVTGVGISGTEFRP